jgi:hypothetical protein
LSIKEILVTSVKYQYLTGGVMKDYKINMAETEEEQEPYEDDMEELRRKKMRRPERRRDFDDE